jgi:putative ABC transport system permease protein
MTESGKATGLGPVVRAGVGRRRVQTVVMTLTTLLAVAASVLAVGLIVASSAPFRDAFDRLHGAHLATAFDPAKVTAAQLTGTAHVAGVTAAAGPYTTLSLRPRATTARRPSGAGRGVPAGIDLPPVTIAGRADAGGGVDRLDITDGRWASGPGEIVFAADTLPFEVGDRITFAAAPGSPTFTVVGLARSIGRTAQAWVPPDQATALTGPQSPAGYQMLYRFARADTDEDVAAGRAAIAAAVPPGALTGAASYRTTKLEAERTSATFAPFVVAFAVLGLVMSVLIIGIVVSGAVTSATRRIGILKSLGFTPRQVAQAYVVAALIPATVGAALGVALGNLAAIPVLREEGEAFGTGVPGLAPWVSIVVPACALVVVAGTALVPALRAGGLRIVDAIAVGRTPAAGRGRRPRRLLGRLPLPRAVSLGLGNPFTHPGRSATVAAAVALGALGVTFGAGLAMSLAAIQDGLNRRNAGDVIVHAFAPRPGQGGSVVPAKASEIRAVIEAQPGTRRYLRTGRVEVSVAGLAGATTVITVEGDTSWAAYQMISGRWLSGAGEAVVPTAFRNATGVRIGDTITLTSDGRTAPVRVVGEVLDLHQGGQEIVTDAGSLAALNLTGSVEPPEYHIEVQPGTDITSYVDGLNTALYPLHGVAEVNTGEISSIVIAMDTLAGMLTLLLVTVAGLGVLNTVVLDTRDRVHDLGVFKALGMAPRQAVAMVLTSVGAIGLLAGLVGVPAGIMVHHWILPAMGRAAGTAIPQVDVDIYHVPVLVPLALGGLIIAVAGALLPAGWAARTSTTKALRTE